jgi:hypothetical protein
MPHTCILQGSPCYDLRGCPTINESLTILGLSGETDECRSSTTRNRNVAMNSETPKDGVPGPNDDAGRAPGPKGRETPGSLGLELLEQHDDFDITSGHDVLGDDNDGVNTLMSHERKLSLGEQRQILAMRRRAAEDNPEEEMELQTGRRHLLWKLHNDKLGGGMSLMKGTLQPDDAAPSDQPGPPLPLNDTANPDKPMYDAVLKGVSGLDPARVTLTPEEQVNVAGALTASMAQLPGFDRTKADFSTFTFALNDSGDHLFMIHHLDPTAPDALRTSVPLETARTQSLMSSSELIFALHAPKEQEKTGLEQGIPGENPAISPRSLA